MTYTTPELLLVGAAQNLVLETSPSTPGRKDNEICLILGDEPDLDEYQIASNW